jgi:hypothetical protein
LSCPLIDSIPNAYATLIKTDPREKTALKNYTFRSKNTFDVIEKCLASHGGQKLMFDYKDQGQAVALSFAMEVIGRLIGFNLPTRIEQVEAVLKEAKR